MQKVVKVVDRFQAGNEFFGEASEIVGNAL
jgi:hypothetical protein